MAFGLEDFTNLAQATLGFIGSTTSAVRRTSNLRQAASAAANAGEVNAKIERFNTAKSLEHIARQTQRILGEQQVQSAASGFSSTSKSFLMQKAAGISELERQIVERTQASKVQQDIVRFEARSRAAALSQQAQASQIQQRRQTTSNLLNLGTSLLSLFN